MNDLEPRVWDLSEQEFDAVSALPAGERYNHFVKRVVDWEWVWVLEGPDGGLASSSLYERSDD